MQRVVLSSIESWLGAPNRKPLVLRGARQVGKTWLVRELARTAKRNLVEVNFERDPQFQKLFASNDPQHILGELSLAFNRDVNPSQSLLFLDEIQAAGEVLAKLRWFAEEMPDLPVVAAGSLLEFALKDHSLSMPVGRISYLYIEPMGFPEYLMAHSQQRLLDALQQWQPGQTLSATAHTQASQWFARYLMVGGMPAVVLADVERNDPRECRRLQRDLITTFRDDFAKYSTRATRSVLDSVLLAVSSSIGRKFVYAHIDEGVKSHQARAAIELLSDARVCHLIRYSAATGLPLGGAVKDTFRKAILLDVGLLHALIGTPAAGAFPDWTDLASQTREQLADQVTGQQLRLMLSHSGNPSDLYYWQREGGRPGEIDYLIQLSGRILPIELKAGPAGAMKSLHQFMFEKKLSLAARIDANPPSIQDIDVRTTQGNPTQYRLINLPHYLTWRLADIVAGLQITN